MTGKIVANAQEAMDGVFDGMRLMSDLGVEMQKTALQNSGKCPRTDDY